MVAPMVGAPEFRGAPGSRKALAGVSRASMFGAYPLGGFPMNSRLSPRRPSCPTFGLPWRMARPIGSPCLGGVERDGALLALGRGVHEGEARERRAGGEAPGGGSPPPHPQIKPIYFVSRCLAYPGGLSA